MTAAIIDKKTHNGLIIKLFLIVVGMFGFGYALVPLYQVFCDITGLNGKVATEAVIEKKYEVDLSREISLEFVTSVNEQTPIKFWVESPKVKVFPGRYYTVNFWAENLTGKDIIARAIPSVTPGLATPFVKKIECFCFDKQPFAKGEKKLMPVRFVLDPELPELYNTITLSYTFFDVTDEE